MELCCWDNDTISDYMDYQSECQKRVRDRQAAAWTEADQLPWVDVPQDNGMYPDLY